MSLIFVGQQNLNTLVFINSHQPAAKAEIGAESLRCPVDRMNFPVGLFIPEIVFHSDLAEVTKAVPPERLREYVVTGNSNGIADANIVLYREAVEAVFQLISEGLLIPVKPKQTELDFDVRGFGHLNPQGRKSKFKENEIFNRFNDAIWSAKSEKIINFEMAVFRNFMQCLADGIPAGELICRVRSFKGLVGINEGLTPGVQVLLDAAFRYQLSKVN